MPCVEGGEEIIKHQFHGGKVVSPVEYRQGPGPHPSLHLCSRHLPDFHCPTFPPTALTAGLCDALTLA